ncbi:TIGR01244 family sulfur transferase [Brevundimonas aurantiaca]|uniref:TIGR01244 family sulfur transferase n=1 Tax=Brevundimonas aurantiaca TaxID=74316 RepID=UPI0019180004|nr:TIGR01244 family sulfur transferase [Brevundimonas aurantiaca]
MDIRPLDEALSASPQIAPEDLPAIAAQGFRSVISNRPDGEEPGQPSSEDLRQAAEAAGLAFAHVPVVGGAISDQDVADFREALANLPQPVFGFCRTGTRTTTLWALANVASISADDLIARAKSAGYDLGALRPRLEGAAS